MQKCGSRLLASSCMWLGEPVILADFNPNSDFQPSKIIRLIMFGFVVISELATNVIWLDSLIQYANAMWIHIFMSPINQIQPKQQDINTIPLLAKKINTYLSTKTFFYKHWLVMIQLFSGPFLNVCKIRSVWHKTYLVPSILSIGKKCATPREYYCLEIACRGNVWLLLFSCRRRFYAFFLDWLILLVIE